jgi:two-component system, NarL family, nitrate/nitrite response regulator NarL
LSTPRHFFLCETGELLPRWREAFPTALVGKKNGRHEDTGPEVVWLRLVRGVAASEQLREARRCFAQAALIALSDLPDDGEALEAFASGAKGYCNTHSSIPVLQQVASVVHQGGMWIGPSLMQRLLLQAQGGYGNAGRSNWSDVLTARELEVARTLASGASNKEIAVRLGITERTVKSHVGHILEKLNLRDRLQLAMLIRDQQVA